MNEARFRSLVHEVIGEAPMGPWLNDGVRARIALPVQPASRAPFFAAVAAFLLFAVLTIALVPRILSRGHTVTPGAATSSRLVTPSPVQPLACTLPVIIYEQFPGPDPTQPWNGGTEAARHWGFVSTSSGAFTPDPSAAQASRLPIDPPEGAPNAQALSYSSAAKRWLPVGPERVSPDGLSYAYLGDRSARTLVRYDITTGRSVKLWQAPVQLEIVRWTASGIVVNVGDQPGPLPNNIALVDPVTGEEKQLPPPPSPRPPPVPQGSFLGPGPLGTTSAGDPISQAESINGDTATNWVYIDTAGGERITIYHGSGPVGQLETVNGVMQHKATGFEAGAVIAEGGDLWFATLAPTFTVWHWDEARGLSSVDIAFADPSLLEVMPAGPCF